MNNKLNEYVRQYGREALFDGQMLRDFLDPEHTESKYVNRLMLALRERIDGENLPRVLHLGAGGCRICAVCAVRTNEPCRHPDKATPSLESYGVDVASMAEAAGMKYINGQKTVTYFGAVLFDPPESDAPEAEGISIRREQTDTE